MEMLTDPQVWLAFVTLTALEVVSASTTSSSSPSSSVVCLNISRRAAARSAWDWRCSRGSCCSRSPG